MTTRVTRTRRSVWRALLVAAFVALALPFGAQAATAAPPPSPPAPTQSASISGPGVKGAMSFAKAKDAAHYGQLVGMVSWMDGQPGNIISTTPSDLGPDYTVKLSTGGKVTKIYDLYPLCPGGARAYRTDGGTGGTWFYAPNNLVDSLTALGVPVTQATAPPGAATPRAAAATPASGLGDVLRESRGALLLAGFAAALVLVLLAMAARVSRRSERRRTTPAAVARLAAATARRTGQFPVVTPSGSRPAGKTAPGAPRGSAPVRASAPAGTDRARATAPWFGGPAGQQQATTVAAAAGIPQPGTVRPGAPVPGQPGVPGYPPGGPGWPAAAEQTSTVRASASVPVRPPTAAESRSGEPRVVAVARVPSPHPTDVPGGPAGPGQPPGPAGPDLGVAAEPAFGSGPAGTAAPGAVPDPVAPDGPSYATATRGEPIPQPHASPFDPDPLAGAPGDPATGGPAPAWQADPLAAGAGGTARDLDTDSGSWSSGGPDGQHGAGEATEMRSLFGVDRAMPSVFGGDRDLTPDPDGGHPTASGGYPVPIPDRDAPARSGMDTATRSDGDGPVEFYAFGRPPASRHADTGTGAGSRHAGDDDGGMPAGLGVEQAGEHSDRASGAD